MYTAAARIELEIDAAVSKHVAGNTRPEPWTCPLMLAVSAKQSSEFEATVCRMHWYHTEPGISPLAPSAQKHNWKLRERQEDILSKGVPRYRTIILSSNTKKL
jgi:hypothetical protein